ncbi:PREDICTED: pentatricopeptide repeat-containing protein At3g24000, mitochondrial [Nelumbo nucifera]|uniref:Pentatricopeptide repeat-containing protein At3g24000, mitochondrial n=2 Tax=Nelumbo nucifera TaxID=4432 RepID=A0A1U8Q8L8_NELNU|nr:PREDICTED: pentatricopeptide repeat-containing protein At3g24000, mitochondrial [Nelumbo nucifera]XP_010270911.1 PREDICTED: pentatricopeptide repeat-containing protein At3g24000, mitochondrial [Nelumbo nucifera]XP_010270912.1 PREDICTED: pentatricopeptide repeat-containing protein At3g24000, mitochondrial [Nelumbo nucifera]XP_010270913.1 PREDICTED: pentatricopeptide repeat-containing protein At3g24000, mitochondrial [Nelumbo nucifera]XP_010270914.1 PREDICTED: pentatricopeptide repeat-containi
MKKLLCTGPLSLSIVHMPTRLCVQLLLSLPFCSSVVHASLTEYDSCEEGDASCIIQEKDLLCTSNTESGLHVLDLLDHGLIDPDPMLYNKLLKKCTQLKRVKEGKIVHAHILNSKFKSDLYIQNSILHMYAKCGCLDDARSLFNEMPLKDMVTWTAMITGYSQNDKAEEAIELFPQMLKLGLKPNQYTFSSLLKASGAAPSDKNGRQIHAFCTKYGYESNVYVGSSLLDMYARFGKMEEAQLVFDGMVTRNEVSWNALIAGHARKGEGENTLRLFWEMLREDYKPTHFTYSSVFSGCASVGALEQGKWVHAYMIKSGGKLIAFLGNTLVDMYAKSGSIDDARKVFNRLETRDVVSWNSILTGCAQHGLARESLSRFEEMLRIGVKPNEITFLCVLTACSHGGLLNEGQHYFELMKKYQVEPKVEHYVTIVDLLGRAGLLDQAKEFIGEMPIEPTAAVWGALLGACRMHGNMELGTFAAERVFELDPHDSGPHVLLYNIYASAGRWVDAATVRKMMKESGVKKEPACSWVEIENTVHMFVANDDTHPQRKEIHRMWEKISGKIKEVGYVPDPSHVLLFVDQQEREAKLQYHSEKLALAFALLNTTPGSTIRIKKNIRMCGDCHSAIKFVSKVMDREIIVRDTNRFHHFSNGSCSCGDYW